MRLPRLALLAVGMGSVFFSAPFGWAQQDDTVAQEEEEECPQSKPSNGQACQRPEGSPACAYDHLWIPVSTAEGKCDTSAPPVCTPMATCECQKEGYYICLDTEMEFCSGDIQDNAFTDCDPKEEQEKFLQEKKEL